MDAQYTLSTFTPGEAEAITGLTTTMQRDWRRPERGYLSKTDGHARFDCFDLAKMLVMKALADRGIGPQQSLPIADWSAAGVCWEAMGWKDAFEGDHERTFDWQPESMRPKREMTAADRAVVDRMPEAVRADLLADGAYDGSWGEKSEWLRRQITRLKGFPRIIPARFLIWWADGDHAFTVDLAASFDGMTSGDPRVAGPVIVLDLNALGSNLIDRAGRPLVHVEFPADFETGEITSPVEYGAPVPLKSEGEE